MENAAMVECIQILSEDITAVAIMGAGDYSTVANGFPLLNLVAIK